MSQHQQFTNRLLNETSPYLRQHAHNPVDWYPWGPEALARARELDRPIFLSIGYSACHWCHVMEHESFEDPEVAALLNQHFVSIKVDREERPDLDQIYMTAVQMLTRHGGWPMSMFLMPDLKPFYGGTYFPPQDRHGLPSFRRVLLSIIDAWQHRRAEIQESAGAITEQLQQVNRVTPTGTDPQPGLLKEATSSLSRVFDSTFGGFGHAPKFPHSMDLRMLLRAWKRFGDEHALRMARHTLDRMAMGGIYDHLGGGFHRYSTDARWLVPHFEKMLYDNALLSVVYLEGYQATGDEGYRRVVEETLDYVLREMTSPEGPFYSTQDADSEGEEGKFYVWSSAEIEALLGKDVAETFGYVYDITPEGNWEGHNILHRNKTDEQDARLLRVPVVEMRQVLDAACKRLVEARSQRVWPGRDEKALTSWNGLMIDAMARAGAMLDRPRFTEAAVRAADFFLGRMRTPDGRLLRTYSAGSSPKLNGYLEDYAFLLEALVSLYEATFEPRWIESALDLAAVMIDQFWDPAEGGFFYTGRDHEQLIARTRDPHDSSIPSGNSMTVTALLRLARLTGRADLLEKAEATLRLFLGLMEQSSMAAGQMLVALDFYLGTVEEFAVVGDPNSEAMRRVLRAIRQGFRPNKVVAVQPTAGKQQTSVELIPLLAGKDAQADVTTYHCQNYTCRAPLTGAAAAEQALRG
jgi:uncharacterized protein YyaL (SSP411 family)